MKPRVGVFSFTSCEGCQLAILNCEDELLDLLGHGLRREVQRYVGDPLHLLLNNRLQQWRRTNHDSHEHEHHHAKWHDKDGDFVGTLRLDRLAGFGHEAVGVPRVGSRGREVTQDARPKTAPRASVRVEDVAGGGGCVVDGDCAAGFHCATPGIGPTSL